MTKKIELKQWNYHALMLGQAMLGSISPNFRIVILFIDDNNWVVRFYLEEDTEEDTEEIEDIICQFEGNMDFTLGFGCRVETVFGDGELQFPMGQYRPVFRRRE